MKRGFNIPVAVGPLSRLWDAVTERKRPTGVLGIRHLHRWLFTGILNSIVHVVGMTMDDNTDHARKECRICGDSFHLTSRDEYGEVLDHYQTHHYDTDILHEVMDDTCIRTACLECGKEFSARVHVGPQSFGVSAYCSDCIDADPFRKVMATTIDGQTIMTNEICG